MTDDNNIKLKRYLAYGIAGLLLLWVLVWLFHYLNTGLISVTVSGSQNSVTITGVGDTKGMPNNTYRKQATGHLSVRLPSGMYLISAQGHVWTTNKIVTLHARQKLNYTFKQSPVATPEPVTGTNASDISADDSQLFYINPDVPGLYKIDGQNNSTPVNSDGGVALRSVKWADTGYGVGQDDSGNLYVVNDVSIAPLKTPSGFSLSKKINYAVTESRQIYLSIDRDIYLGTDNGNFQRIYTATLPPVRLIPSSSNLGIVTLDNGRPVMTIVTPGGKLLNKSGVDGSVAVWSPDGKKLALNALEGSGEILDSALNRIAVLPNSSNGDVWLNNNTLLYGSGNMIWSYSLDTKDSVLIASLAPGNSINEVSLDKNSHYVYLAVQNSSGGAELDRVGLLGQKVPGFIYQLDVFFPKNVGACNINYVNFASLAALSVTAQDSMTACQGLVQTELIYDRLNPSELRVDYVNSAPVSSD